MSSAPSPDSHSSDEKSPPSPSTSSPPPKDSLASPPPPPPSPSKNDNGSSSPPSSGNNNKSSPPPTSSSKDNSPSPPHSSHNDSNSPSLPHHTTSTSPNTATPSSDSVSSSNSGSSSHKTLVAGVILGIGFLLIVMMIICVVCSRRRKRKSEKMQYYYGEHSSHPGPKYYNNNTQQQSWHNQPQDHIVRINAQAGDGQGWRSPPPPPPHMLNSVDTSGSLSGQRGPPLPPPSPSIALGFNKSTFTYDELAAATNGFSQANLLGQGGFGYVHKGVLPNGKEVAVKSLKLNSGQGEREFQAEVEIISRVHHRHLVSLVGYCIAGGQRMLVYEFVPNKTLEYHLHVNHLDWPTRLRIAIGSAKGLAYIHEDCHPRIIHRDIKAANILIDNNFEAMATMVADFGLAKLSSDNYTHVSTRVMGTFGYLAPEYASSGKLTEKSDVFSFGIMLLEIITGKQPVDHTTNADDSLVDWARPLLTRAIEEGIYDSLVDPRLENNFNTVEMARMIASAAACIRHSARKRPRMSQVVRALDGDVSLEDWNEGVKPGHSSVYNSSADYDADAYNADMIKFRKIALSSHEFLTGEHGTGSSNDSQ